MLLFALGVMAGEAAPVSQGMPRAWMGFFHLHPLQTGGCLPSKLDNFPLSPDNYQHQSRIMISSNCAAPPKERGDWVFPLSSGNWETAAPEEPPFRRIVGDKRQIVGFIEAFP